MPPRRGGPLPGTRPTRSAGGGLDSAPPARTHAPGTAPAWGVAAPTDRGDPPSSSFPSPSQSVPAPVNIPCPSQFAPVPPSISSSSQPGPVAPSLFYCPRCWCGGTSPGIGGVPRSEETRTPVCGVTAGGGDTGGSGERGCVTSAVCVTHVLCVYTHDLCAVSHTCSVSRVCSVYVTHVPCFTCAVCVTYVVPMSYVLADACVPCVCDVHVPCVCNTRACNAQVRARPFTCA